MLNNAGRATATAVVVALAASLPATAAAQSWCAPGTHLSVLWQGTRYPATAKGPSPGGQCKISYDGFGAQWDEAVGPDRASPAGGGASFGIRGDATAETSAPRLRASGGGASPEAAAPRTRISGGGVKPGPYHCTMFVGPLRGGHLVDAAPFTVGSGGTSYTDRNGARGTLSLGGDGTAEFHGGNYDRQAAKYEPSSGGRAVLRIYNEARSRTVIDCEGPAN